MNGEAAPTPTGSGLDVFTNLFGQISVKEILPLGNGLAFLALLLAAVLIAISMVRGKTEPTTAQLIRSFFFVAIFFVVTTIGVDVLRIFVAPPAVAAAPVSLRIEPIAIQEMEETFPIVVYYNGQVRDIFTEPLDTTLSSDKNFIMINANVVAGRLKDRTRLISELTKSVETNAPPSTPAALAPTIDFTGG